MGPACVCGLAENEEEHDARAHLVCLRFETVPDKEVAVGCGRIEEARARDRSLGGFIYWWLSFEAAFFWS